jgi:hypothetical protein
VVVLEVHKRVGDFISPVCASNAAGASRAGKKKKADEVIC